MHWDCIFFDGQIIFQRRVSIPPGSEASEVLSSVQQRGLLSPSGSLQQREEVAFGEGLARTRSWVQEPLGLLLRVHEGVCVCVCVCEREILRF